MVGFYDVNIDISSFFLDVCLKIFLLKKKYVDKDDEDDFFNFFVIFDFWWFFNWFVKFIEEINK